MHTSKLTEKERKAVFGLSSIMGLRMVGLFMVLPVFSLYAHDLSGATPMLIGLAMGIYGLAQAFAQISFGSLSDKIGRKPMIAAGLLIFALGSIFAGASHSIWGMIAGRTLQGVGAVGSTSLAMLADLTREDQRTKAMMLAGIAIGLSFSLAIFAGPIFMRWVTVNELFYIAAIFAIGAIAILYVYVPSPGKARWHRDTEIDKRSVLTLLFSKELAKLNAGIFLLHTIFTASFVVIPVALLKVAGLDTNSQWEVYLPALTTALIVSLTCIGIAERKQKVKTFFIGAVACIAASQVLLIIGSYSTFALTLGISVFFAAFTLLESFLPSLISRTAPAANKGSAMGIYSCAQYLGIFAGGVLGGWLYGALSYQGVYFFCFSLALIWSIIAYNMQQPRYLVTQVIRLADEAKEEWDSFATILQLLPGMVEVAFVAEDGLAYLKMERATTKHPDFIRLKDRIQSNYS